MAALGKAVAVAAVVMGSTHGFTVRPQSYGMEPMPGKILFFPVQLTTNRIGNHTRLIHTVAVCVTIHK